MRTAYSYIRFSTPEQRKGNSLQRQLDASRMLAERHGWRLDTSLRFSDLGRSAFKAGKQVELERFIRLIKEGVVKAGSILIIERLDRFSRQDVDVALELFMRIIREGVDIATLNPDTIHTRESIKHLTGLIMPVVELAEANAASLNKSLRAIDNWNRKRQRGGPLTARCPAWLRLEGDKFALIPGKAKVVRKIFKMAIDGMGARRIVKHLNESGIVNIAQGTKRNIGPTWTQEYVERILANRQTIGEYQAYRLVDGERIPEGPPQAGYYPAVVDGDTFFAAQAAKQSRYRQRGPAGHDTANLFTGLLYDARSGSTMRLCNSSQSEKAAGCFRRLASYHATHGAAPFVSWKHEHFEEGFLAAVREIAVADLLPKASDVNRLPALQGRLADVERRISEVEAAIATEAEIKPFLSVLKRLADDKATIEGEIEGEQIRLAQERGSASSDLLSVLDLLAKAKGDERQRLRDKLRAVMRLLISEIWVLIDELDDKPRLRICVAQVFFRNGDHRQFMLWRQGYKKSSGGNPSVKLPGAPCPPLDLRTWRYHCSPIIPPTEYVSLMPQKPIPTPDGSAGMKYAIQFAEREELALAGV